MAMSISDSTDQTLIVLAAPSVNNNYYAAKFMDIVVYMTTFAGLVDGKDQMAILVDAATWPYFQGKVPSSMLIKADMEDIWIRDFSPVIPARQVKFKFAPSYLGRQNQKAIRDGFDKWASRHGLQYHTTSNIILDGGNVVDNPAGTRAIITDRVLRDNPSLTKATGKEKLRELLGVNEVAIIKEIPGDTTGHADGILMWITDDRILLAQEAEPLHSEMLDELKSSFPGVEVIELPNYYIDETWRNFTSARNVFINSVVTDNYVYMPTFGSSHDAEMSSLFQSLTSRTVVSVPTGNISMMGGSVRCLTWQVKGTNRMKILQATEQ